MAELFHLAAAASAGLAMGLLVIAAAAARPAIAPRSLRRRLGWVPRRAPRVRKLWERVRQRLPLGPARPSGVDLEFVLLALAAEVEAGRSLAQALAQVAHEVPAGLAEDLQRLATQATGGDAVAAIRRWADRTGDPVLEDLVATLEVHRGTGGSLAPLLYRLATVVRERRSLEAQARAKTAEARLSARVLAWSPVVLTLYFAWLRPGWFAPLWEDAAGRWALAYAFVSWLAGLVVIRALLQSIERMGR